MSGLDLVQEYFPDATEDECDYILWNETCFPFRAHQSFEASVDHWRLQIAKLKCTTEILCGGPYRTAMDDLNEMQPKTGQEYT